jgi:hypothetical protein
MYNTITTGTAFSATTVHGRSLSPDTIVLKTSNTATRGGAPPSVASTGPSPSYDPSALTTSLMEFTLFPKLPIELRREIFKHAPQVAQVV